MAFTTRPKRRSAIDIWVVPIGDGWDPRMDALTGRVVCGNTTLSLVDPGTRTMKLVATTPARLLRWLSPDRLIWQRSTSSDTAELWSCPAYDLSAVTIAPLDPAIVCGNSFAASTGRWASWLSKGLRLSVGTLTTAAPLLTNVYECQMAGDWLVTTRDRPGMGVVWLKWAGTEWIVVSESAPLTYPQYWANPSGIVGVGYYGPCGVIAPGQAAATDVTCTPWQQEGIPRVIDVEDVRYVVTAAVTPEEQAVAYVRTLAAAIDPARRTKEIQTIPLPFGFTAFEGRGWDGRLELAGCDAGGRLALVSVDLAALPVGPVVPGPEPPIPPIPVQEPPRATITSYGDLGEAPFACRATWAPEAGSGPIDTVTWLASVDNRLWVPDATNPATDPDHTYLFLEPGTYYLRLTATGPGGTATTGAERKVTVMATPTPPVPMLETSAFRLASGSLLCADQHEGNRVNATRTEIGAWESFLVESHPIGGAWVALKADTGYVCTEATGHQLRADGTASTALPLRLIELAEGTVALMASDGFYVWAENGGGGVVLRNGSRIDAFSTFAVFPGIPKEAAPPEPVVPSGGKPSLERASRGNGAFLGVPDYKFAFMYPGYSPEKRAAYRMTLKAKGLTHIPFAPWGAYGSDAPFDYRKRPEAFRDLINETQNDGCVVMLFAITDGLPGDKGYTEDDAHHFIRGWLSQFGDIVRFFVGGWEFPQINSGFGSQTASGPTTGNLPTTPGGPTNAGTTTALVKGIRERGVETEEEIAHHVRMRKLRRTQETVLTTGPETDPRSYTPLPAHSHRLYWAWSGDAHLRIAQTLRQTFGPDALVYVHFTPERITGWPDWGHTSSDPRGEPDWWKADKDRAMTGILYQRPYNEPEQFTAAHTIGGKDEDGGYDIGDCERITKAWGIYRSMIIFEYSRDMARSARLAGPFSDKRLSGNTNQPA